MRQRTGYNARVPSGRWRWQIFGFVLGGLLAMSISPVTGWLAKKPLLMSLHLYRERYQEQESMTGSQGMGKDRSEVSRTLKALSGNVTLETAAALQLGQKQGVPEDLQGLSEELAVPLSTERLLANVRSKYPTVPLPFAASNTNFEKITYLPILRTPHFAEKRGEKQAESAQQSALPSEKTKKKVEEIVLAMLHANEQAEKIDPSNAYFSLMLAVALNAAHDDREALAAIDRALAKNRFESYDREISLSDIQAQEVLYGRRSVLERSTTAGIGENRSNAIDTLGSALLDKAMALEKEGDWQSGLALRQRAMRLWVMLREYVASSGSQIEAKMLLGNWKPKELAPIPTVPPENPVESAKWARQPEAVKEAQLQTYYRQKQEREQQNRRRALDAYLRYLEARGQHTEAKWVAEQVSRSQEYRSLPAVNDPGTIAMNLFRGSDENAYEKPWNLLYRLLGLACLFLFPCGATALLVYQRRFQPRRQPLAAAEKWGIALGLMVTIFSVVPLLTNFQGELTNQPVVLGIFTLLLASMASQLAGRNLSSFLKTMLMTSGMTLITFWLAVWMATGLMQEWNMDTLGLYHTVKMTMLMFLLPLFLAGVLALWSWKHKVPAASGALESYGKVALPLVSLLLCGYIGIAFVTTYQEAQARNRFLRAVADPFVFSEEMKKRETP